MFVRLVDGTSVIPLKNGSLSVPNVVFVPASTLRIVTRDLEGLKLHTLNSYPELAAKWGLKSNGEPEAIAPPDPNAREASAELVSCAELDGGRGELLRAFRA